MTADAVLLIDLENMVGDRAKPAGLAAKVDALTTQAGPGVPAVAACAASRITQPGASALQDRGIKLLRTADTKDAADHALIDEARRLAEDGCRRFLVASSDNRFAALADLGTLEIILWKAQKSATKYTSRAKKVHRVARPDTAAARPATAAASPRNAGTAARTTPAKAAPAKTAPAKTAPARPVTAAEPAPLATPARRIRPAHVAAAAAGVTAAGILFGAGSVLGAMAALRLLHRAALLPVPGQALRDRDR